MYIEKIRNILFPKKKVVSDLRKYFGKCIYFGPFSGIEIPDEVYGILTLSEKLGFYESCLHDKLSELLNREIKSIVLIGGNNGYYAAGLTNLFLPQKIEIYETEETFHSKIKSWFDLNKLGNYKIKGEAKVEDLILLDSEIDLLFIDCEGAEEELLNPNQINWQKKADIIVEIHPFYRKKLINKIVDRFKGTHTVEIIYDDFNEDDKISKILKELNLKVNYSKHPTHRWIDSSGSKLYTCGMFLFLKRKEI